MEERVFTRFVLSSVAYTETSARIKVRQAANKVFLVKRVRFMLLQANLLASAITTTLLYVNPKKDRPTKTWGSFAAMFEGFDDPDNLARSVLLGIENTEVGSVQVVSPNMEIDLGKGVPLFSDASFCGVSSNTDRAYMIGVELNGEYVKVSNVELMKASYK